MVNGLRREVLLLITLVLIIDGIFVLLYFAAGIRHSSDVAKVVFTGAWTLAVLLVAIRSLSKIRSARLKTPQP
jgi:hypothetical protein